MEADNLSTTAPQDGIKYKIVKPLNIKWNPRKDITAYELALCTGYLLRDTVMPDEIAGKEFFRHFDIQDPNI